MAVNIRQLFPIRQAKERRIALTRYLRLDGGRHLIAAALLLSLMSLISLGQTGNLAAKGYELSQLQAQRSVLMRERNRLLLELSKAQSLESVERRAVELGLRPLTSDQARYVTIDRSLMQGEQPNREP